MDVAKPKPIIFGTTVKPNQPVEFNINNETISATSNNESSFEILDDKLPKNEITYFRVTESYNENVKTLFFSNFNTSKITYMDNMFYDCGNLTKLDITCFDTSNVLGMWQMFQGCGHLVSLDVSKFNTSKVTDMSQMFASCGELRSLNLSNFNTSKVTDMNQMFLQCRELKDLDLSNFVVNVATIGRDMMFYACDSLLTIKVNNKDSANKLIRQLTDDMIEGATWDASTKIITIPA